MIRLLLVEDHHLIRTGIRHLLQEVKEIEIVGEAGTGEEALSLVRELRPHLVLLDLQLPDISGLEVAARLFRLYPSVKTLIFSSATHQLFPFCALDAGAHGYLTKDYTGKEELVRAIQAVHAGQRIISPATAARMALSKIDRKAAASFQSLTRREIEVILMTMRRTPVKDIGKRLHLSHKTIHSYRSRIFDKLDVNNDSTLTLLAVREGLAALEEVSSQ